MHPSRPPQSKKRQCELASKMASDFEAVPLHNKVHEEIDEDEQLALLLDAADWTRYAQERREDEFGSDAERVDDLSEAAGTVTHIARTRAREIVAEACATVISEADQWVEEGHVGEQAAEDAVEEARQWLRHNTNVSDRLGLLDEVSSR